MNKIKIHKLYLEHIQKQIEKNETKKTITNLIFTSVYGFALYNGMFVIKTGCPDELEKLKSHFERKF